MRFLIKTLALWTLLSPHTHYDRLLPLRADAQLIPEVIESQPDLLTLSRGIEAAGLTGLLSSEGPYTVFGPDNIAFEFALDDKYFEPQWKAHLTEILLQHVVSGPPMETEFWQVGLEVGPLSGGAITVTQVTPTYQVNNGVTVLTPDLPAENGLVHIVDTVILPPSARDSLMDIISVIPDFFSTLESLLTQTGLDQTLRSDGPYTLFAPSNEAFAKLSPDELASLQSDTAALTELLEYHICPGIFLVETLQQDNITTLATLQGTPLPKPLDNVQFVDLLATNGAMHIVDTVLTPPNGFLSETEPPATQAPGPTIADIVVEANWTVFVSALNATGWLETLQGPGPYTVFAVPDDGFDRLPAKFLQDEIWIGHLTNVVTYHIIPQIIMASNLTENATIDTLNFNSISVTSGDPLQINGVNVTTTDIEADNGVVHVLDEVLLPPSATDTALDLFNGFDQFSILSNLVASTGLSNVFSGTGPITAFAPIDSAFEALPEGSLEALENDPDALRNILLYHVSPELVEFVALGPNEVRNVTTVQSGNVTFQFDNGVARINEAQVLFQDLLVQNGIVQVIDTVLTAPPPPPIMTVEPTEGASTAAPTDAATPVQTAIPTAAATTNSPTGTPTEAATTNSPTGIPTQAATTSSPTGMATDAATTSAPTGLPTQATTTSSPTDAATSTSPTNAATSSPTGMPTQKVETASPTAPTELPPDISDSLPGGGTESPAETPQGAPSDIPTAAPSDSPEGAPSDTPTVAPSQSPESEPSDIPTGAPTDEPTSGPTKTPTGAPVSEPTGAPTKTPTKAPTNSPTKLPTETPTKAATNPPTKAPTRTPTLVPVVVEPTAMPVFTIPPSDECVTIPGQTVCCPPGETTGVFFFCRYL